MDLSAHSNVGYAFINFVKANDLITFYNKFHLQKWKRHKSQKICEIAFGRLQGKNELISQFRERNNRVTIPKGKYSKRRRSNVVIVTVIFIS